MKSDYFSSVSTSGDFITPTGARQYSYEKFAPFWYQYTGPFHQNGTQQCRLPNAFTRDVYNVSPIVCLPAVRLPRSSSYGEKAILPALFPSTSATITAPS